MLYFTKIADRSRSIRAIYSGRFAFIPAIGAGEAEHLMTAVRGKPSPTPIRLPGLVDAFEEEFRHARLALQCDSGLTLSGLRVWARLLWATRRSEPWVETYYRLRTLFYLRMYEPQEEVVEVEMRRKSDGENMDVESGLAKVAHADLAVRRQWRALMLGRQRVAWTVMKPFFRLLGFVMARHFTVVTLEWEENRLLETNVARGGLINTSGSFGAEPGSLYRRLLSRLRIEHHWPNDMTSDWRWMLLKFRVEREMLQRSRSVEWRFEDYTRRVFAFVETWARLDDIGPAMYLDRLVNDPSGSGRQGTPPRGWEKDPRRRKLVNFFYMHGN